MLKKTLTFDDLDGNPVTEDFYFNLSKAEIAEMELSHESGFSGYLEEIIASNNPAKIVETFKKIILAAIGRRSDDGRRFIKNQEIIDDFVQTDAYSQLFMSFMTDADAAANFVKGIMPADMVAELNKTLETTPDKGNPEKPRYILEDREPTNAELAEMSQDEIREAFARRLAKRQGEGHNQ